MRILLVDDNPTDVAQSLDALAAQGLARSVRVARGGQEALDFLFGRGQFQDRRRHPLPDLVLLDMNMPRVDGFRVLRQMRRSEALKRIPVVALCRSAEEALRAIAGEVRANGCLVKPLARADFDSLEQDQRNWTLRLDLPETSEEESPRERRAASGCEELVDRFDGAPAREPFEEVDLLLHREGVPRISRGGAGRG